MTDFKKTEFNREQWLPKWFISATADDPDAYFNAKYLDHQGWITQIESRLIYLNADLLREGEIEDSATQDLDEKNAGYSVFEEIMSVQKQSIVTVKPKVDFLPGISIVPDTLTKPEKTKITVRKIAIKKFEGVNELTLSEHFRMLFFYSSSLKNSGEIQAKLNDLICDFQKSEFDSDIVKSSEDSPSNKNDILDMCFSEIHPEFEYFNLSVNSLIPDLYLNEQFTEIIEMHRHNSGRYPLSIKYKKKMTDWINARVLQYLDLKYWSDVNDMNLTEQNFADAIFYDSDKIAKDIEKVTKVNATQFLSDQMIKYLKAMDSSSRI